MPYISPVTDEKVKRTEYIPVSSGVVGERGGGYVSPTLKFDPTFRTQTQSPLISLTEGMPDFGFAKTTLMVASRRDTPISHSLPVTSEIGALQEEANKITNIYKRNAVIGQAPDTRSPQQKIFDKNAPSIIKTIVNDLKEGFLGRGQEVDMAGNLKETGGLIQGFFSGISKSDFAKVDDRYNKLIKNGVTPERATQISIQYANQSISDPVIKFKNQDKKEKSLESLQLTSVEKSALRKVGFFETLEKGLDAINFIGSIGVKNTAKIIAKETYPQVIKKILKKEIPNITDEMADSASRVLANQKDVEQIEKFLSELDFGINKYQKKPIPQNPLIPDNIKTELAQTGADVPLRPLLPVVDETSLVKLSPAAKAVKDGLTEVRDKTGIKLQDPHTAEYLPVNKDGTITVYHSTTKEGANKIRQDGLLGSKVESGDIYFTTNRNGYGGIGKDKDTVLAFNVDPNKIKFDDVYRGELHLKGNNADIGGIKPIELKTTSQLRAANADELAKSAVAKQLPTPEGLPEITKKRQTMILSPELENLKMQISFLNDAVQGMTAGKKLSKYVSRKTGELPEVTGKKNRSIFGQKGDTIYDELVGYKASYREANTIEEAQKVIDDYQRAKQNLEELKVSFKEGKSEFLTEKKLNEIAERGNKLDEVMRDFVDKYPELAKATITLSKEATKNAKVGYDVGIKKVGVKYKEGIKIGKAETENIAKTKLSEAVRKEQLTSLEKGIKLRIQKNEIIEALRSTYSNTIESAARIKKMIVDHVKDALSPSNRGKALVLVKDAKTQKDLIKAFSRINGWAEDAIKIELKNDILKTQKSIMESPSIAIDYKTKVKELMGDFELKGHRDETLERLRKTREFLEAEAEKGNDIEMPRRILKALELLNRTPFEEITINQLKGLKAEMELLEEIGRTKLRTQKNLVEIQKAKIITEIELQGAKPINKIQLIKPEIGERLSATQKFKNFIFTAINKGAEIDRAISPMDTIFDLLDGGKGLYNGANFRFFKGQVDAGYGRFYARKEALHKPVIDLAKKHKLDDRNFERMGVVAARDQDSGIEKLIASGFSEEKVNAIKLTTQEQEVLDLMRSTFDSQFPEIQDTMRRVYNQPVEKVKNYFSFMTDWKAMDDSEVFERFGSQSTEQYGAPKKNVEAGFAKSRVGGDQKIKINALDVFMQHTENTSYLLELGETSKMLGEVAASPRYGELVGDAGQLMVREWVDVVARKGGASGASTMQWMDVLRKNVGAGILGLKLSTVAIQPTALIDGMGFIGAKYGMKGVTNFATSKEWRKFVLNMPEIKDRMGGEFAIRELTDDSWLQKAQKKGFIPMQTLDQMTAGSIAAGAYERKMIELGQGIDLTKPFNEEALAYAQLAVRRTQSSGQFKDVASAITRGTISGNRSFDRAALQFQNFLLTRWSRIRHDAIRAGINEKDPKKAVPILMAIIFAGLAVSGIRLGVNKIQDFITGREDKDTVAEDLTKSFVYEMTGNVPFLGTVVSMTMYDGEFFPIIDAPKGVISGINRVITSKSESAKLRGFTELAGSAGAVLGIPGSTQAEQLARGFLQEKKASPKPKTLKTPAGLPKLPSIKKRLPTLPGLPKLP